MNYPKTRKKGLQQYRRQIQIPEKEIQGIVFLSEHPVNRL
jgi:hypothetical protein